MIKFSPLNKELNLFNRYTVDIVEFIASHVNKEQFVLPTLYTFLREFKCFRDKLIENYNLNYGDLKGFEGVSDDVKIYQSAMDEGMIFALNLNSKKLGLYSSRLRTLNFIDKENKFNKDKTVEKNLEGVVHCMRLDVSYVGDDETEVEIKNTSRDKITPETHVLIPYNVINSMERFFQVNFKRGRVVKVSQNLDGVLKERYLTENPSILANHNENWEVVASESWYFSGVGALYAPVLGAPSNTSGLSRVDLVNIDKLQVVKGTENLTEIAKGSAESLYAPQIFSWILHSLMDKDEDKALRFLGVLYSMSSIKSKYPELKTDTLKEFAGKILSAIRLLTDDELEQIKAVFSLVYLDRLDFYTNIFNKYKHIDIPKSLDDLELLLKSGGYKVTVITSGSKLSVIYCTKDEDLLIKVYGEDYETKFASIGTRIRRVNELIKSGLGSEEKWREVYNIDKEVELVPPEIKYEKSDFVRVNLLFSPYTKNEVVDFYRTIKLERVVSIVRIA